MNRWQRESIGVSLFWAACAALWLHPSLGGIAHADQPTYLAELLNGVEFGDGIEVVEEKLRSHTSRAQKVAPKETRFPLAEESEVYWTARDLVTSAGDSLSHVALTFADGTLALVEMRGPGVSAIVERAGEKDFSLAQWEVYLPERLVATESHDHAWILREDALHPHLFLWSNPSIAIGSSQYSPATDSAAIPAALAFGADLEDVYLRLAEVTPHRVQREIDEVWLPGSPKSQIQIDCYGVPYAGFTRKVEAVFGDGVLQWVWILTGKGEEARVREALVQEFGEPHFVSDRFEAFNDWRVGLRKDKPEVLLVAEEMTGAVRAQYGGDSERD